MNKILKANENKIKSNTSRTYVFLRMLSRVGYRKDPLKQCRCKKFDKAPGKGIRVENLQNKNYQEHSDDFTVDDYKNDIL